MSAQSAALRLPLPGPDQAERAGRERTAVPPRARLSVVAAPRHPRARVPFVALCMAVLTASLLGALLLNTSMAQGEYERFSLKSRLAQSAQEQQRLTAALEQAAAPAQLATAARALGMVPTSTGGYLRLSDGAVLGNPVPAAAGQ